MKYALKFAYNQYLRLFRRGSFVANQLYIQTDETAKYIHITEALNHIKVAGINGEKINQNYFEFGVHSARTFSAAVNASKALKMAGTRFYAFDSFSGLPETFSQNDGIFKQGTFKTKRIDFIKKLKKKTCFNYADRLTIVEGFYCDTLTPVLCQDMPSAGVVHIDVDLYSSCRDVLKFITPLLVNGTVLLFDDLYTFPVCPPQGEALAIKEFLELNRHIELIPWKAYSSFGQSYFVKINDK